MKPKPTCFLLILGCWFKKLRLFCSSMSLFLIKYMLYIAFLLSTTICEIWQGEVVLCYPLITRKTAIKHESYLPLSQVTTVCSVLSRFFTCMKVFLRLIVISKIQLWPVYEFYHIQTDFMEKSLFIYKLVLWNFVFEYLNTFFHSFADCKLNYTFWLLYCQNKIWLLMLFPYVH